jgi:hypothetical protein
MDASVDRNEARLKRQRLIETLNAKEAELSESEGGRSQLSDREREVEIEKERWHNSSRRGFGQNMI